MSDVNKQLLEALRTIAGGQLPDGDGVNTPAMMFAEQAIAAAEQAQQVEPVGHFTGEFAGCGDILEFVVRAHGPLPTAGAKLYTKPPAVAVPDGYALVPIEPTEEMFIDGMEADCMGRPSIDDETHVRGIWRAMIAAAQKGGL